MNKDRSFTVEEIKKYIFHRTFAGFTRQREQKPRILLSILGRTEFIEVGFPELSHKEPREGTLFVNEQGRAVKPGTNKAVNLILKGFCTWDEKDYGLEPTQLNTGLILSVKGIPYLPLDMWEYGSRSLSTANPGVKKCCFVVECDELQEEMNISRSDLVRSETTDLLKKAVADIFQRVESSKEYLVVPPSKTGHATPV